jgi:hypothetical protein
MKKFYLVLFLIISFPINKISAQVSNYNFSQNIGSYNSITGGTVLGFPNNDDQYFVTPANVNGAGAPNCFGNGFSIGFTFMYNYMPYDRLGVSANGWISLGQSSLTPAVNMSGTISASQTGYNCISDTSNANPLLRNRISAFCRDLEGVNTPTNQPLGNIRIETIGSAPNRVCVIQFSNYKSWAVAVGNYNFQIRLNETSNSVQIVYGAFSNANNLLDVQVGLRGTSNLDFNNRIVNPTNVWSNSIPGITFTNVAQFNNVLLPTNGLVYEWQPLPPCSGVPSFNAISSSAQLICQNGSSTLSLTNTYNNSGISFQWQSSPSSSGTFSAITTATNTVYSATAISATTFYRCVITCVSTNSSITTPVQAVNVIATTTNSIPYFEGFENILFNNQLPNCSWAVSNSVICQTYPSTPASPVYNRIPRTGNKFASFRFGANDYFYSNGLQLTAGVTYSASAWYITDGLAGWQNFSLLYGNSQNANSLTILASTTSSLNNIIYQPLSATFMVPASGIYYIAVRGTGNSNPRFLTWDDLSVTAPCSINPPSYSIVASSNSICAGQNATLSILGATSYSWETGSNAMSIIVTPTTATSYSAIATSSLGCVGNSVSLQVGIKPTPTISVFSNATTICPSQTINLVALGASSYTWNTGSVNFSIISSPSVNTGYTVTGTGSNGCDGIAAVTISVNAGNPILVSSSASVICAGETVSLSASGGSNYQWSGSVGTFSLGNQISITPVLNTTYTLNANTSNGCSISSFFTQNVISCVGLLKQNNQSTFIKLFPNPTHDKLFVEISLTHELLEIIDLNGKLILSTIISEKNNWIDLKNLTNGLYFTRIISDAGVDTFKIVKE